MMTYQLTVVCSQLIAVGVGEEQQLWVGVDGEVGLDDGLVPANEVSDILDLDLRLRAVPTEGVAAGVAGGSKGCNDNDIMENHSLIFFFYLFKWIVTMLKGALHWLYTWSSFYL